MQYPLTGTYCFVIILMASCATMPPRKAAVLGSSAEGVRTLEGGVRCHHGLGIRRGCLQLSDGIVELLGQFDPIAHDGLYALTKAFDGWR